MTEKPTRTVASLPLTGWRNTVYVATTHPRAMDAFIHRRSTWRRAVGSVLHEACTPCLFPEGARLHTHSWHSSRVFYSAGHPTWGPPRVMALPHATADHCT